MYKADALSQSDSGAYTQLGLLMISKSRLFCIGDQAEFVGIRGRRE